MGGQTGTGNKKKKKKKKKKSNAAASAPAPAPTPAPAAAPAEKKKKDVKARLAAKKKGPRKKATKTSAAVEVNFHGVCSNFLQLTTHQCVIVLNH